MKTLTTAVRRRITADWLGQFPALGEFEPLHLIRRAGPLLEGIVLEPTSGNDVYRPTFHLHCLLRKAPVVTMTLAQRLRSERSGGPDGVTVRQHETKYVEAARTLASQCPLPLSGDLHLSDVLEAYRRFASRPGVHYDANDLYDDMARLCAWCGDNDQANRIISEGFSRLGQWPSDILEQIGGRDAWCDRLAAAVGNRSRLLAMVDEAVEVLRVASVPVAAFVRG